MQLLVRDPLAGAPRRRWTAGEFERLTEIGIFEPGERLELLEGEIIPKMTQHEPHAFAIYLAQTALLKIFGEGFMVRVQLPLALGENNRPEPDIAVIERTIEQHRRAQSTPTSALLVVEVADSSLLLDKGLKASIYAANGIQDYWIVNLEDRVIEVHRTPGPMRGQPTGCGYLNIQRCIEGQFISPLKDPSVMVIVDDFLPET